MRVKVNGEDRELTANMTVAGLIADFELSPKHVAVEVNEELVPRRTHASTILKDGDRIEIVTLVGGG